MAEELSAHNAHLVLTQDSQLSKYTDSLQTSHITIIEALDGVKRIYQDDAMLPKADFVAKYIEYYDEPCLRFMRDILCSVVKRRKGVLLPNLVERKQGDGIKEKLVKDLYDTFSYGEGVREALPKNLFSSSSRHLDSTGTPTQSKQSSEETVNAAQPQEILNVFTSQLNEFKATAFYEILKCRNEISDLRNDLKEARSKTVAPLQQEIIDLGQVSQQNLGLASDDAKRKNNGDEMQSGSSVTDNQEKIKKGTDELNESKVKQGVVLLVSDSLLHKLDVKRFFVKGRKTVKLCKSGDTAKGVGTRALDYVESNVDEVFEAVVLLGGTNDVSKKKVNIENSASDLTGSAQKLLDKPNVKRVFICKVPPRLDSELNDNKVTQFNQIIADYVSEKNFDNLVLVATVSKEIKNFNLKDGLHLNKLGVRRLSAILLKSLYSSINSS